MADAVNAATHLLRFPTEHTPHQSPFRNTPPSTDPNLRAPLIAQTHATKVFTPTPHDGPFCNNPKGGAKLKALQKASTNTPQETHVGGRFLS